MLRAAARGGGHLQWSNRQRFGPRDPLGQRAAAFGAVHQEPDRAKVHPISRDHSPGVEHLVEHVQHLPIAADHHRHFSIVQRHEIVLLTQHRSGFLRARSV